MKKILFFLLCIPMAAHTQNDKGIHFVQGLTWDQVKTKAQSENKNIFINCFATWCGPCKNMERKVYTAENVGAYFNSHFISVKMQLDTTQKDNEDVRSWRQTAHNLQEEYNIHSFPTFMFFSSSGKALHKGLGYMYPERFLALAENALDPSKQYFSLLKAYREGRLQYPAMNYLATAAKSLGYKYADSIAENYIENYLIKLDEHELFTQPNIQFMGTFMNSSRSKEFQLFYNQGDKIDAVEKKNGYAKSIVNNIIFKEEIIPPLLAAYKGGGQPNWRKISYNIKKKYNADYARSNVLDGKLKWYPLKKDWPRYCEYAILFVRNNIPDTATDASTDFTLNTLAWSAIFLHSNKKAEMDEAIQWMERVLKDAPDDPAYMDTYANLLYKAGRTAEAIEWEGKAVALSNKNEDIIRNLNKMKSGEATWAND